jgi:hypothetical protein
MSLNTKLSKTASAMFPLVEKFLGSDGISRNDFCQEHGFTLAKFNWWLRIYRQFNTKTGKTNKSHSNKFIPIKPSLAMDSHPQQCKIEYPNGVVVHLSGQLDITFVHQLIQLAGA